MVPSDPKEAVFVEGFSVVSDGGVGLGSPRNKAIQEFRDSTPRRLLEIVEREIAFQRRRHPAFGAGHGWGRDSGQVGGFVEHVRRSMFLDS